MKKQGLFTLAVAVLLYGLPHAAAAQENDYLVGGIGAFNFIEKKDPSAEGRIEYAPGFRILGLGTYFRGVGPMVGLMGNTDGGVFGYGGIFGDIRLGERVVVRPRVGLGGYREGDSRHLGGVFQFHLGVDLAYRFDNDHRLGVMFAHISNASVHESNPGTNSLLVTYAIPLGSIF
ncbi:MAG: acyloxyacyl hydrolase [Kiloniellaceae bacterium]